MPTVRNSSILKGILAVHQGAVGVLTHTHHVVGFFSSTPSEGPNPRSSHQFTVS